MCQQDSRTLGALEPPLARLLLQKPLAGLALPQVVNPYFAFVTWRHLIGPSMPAAAGYHLLQLQPPLACQNQMGGGGGGGGCSSFDTGGGPGGGGTPPVFEAEAVLHAISYESIQYFNQDL